MTAVIIWRELGFGVVLFLARLLSVPSDMFEAGRIDGARFFRLHRCITIPQLTSVILFYVVVEAITMVSWVFNYVYVMTNGQGGPGDATQVTELYIYQTAFQYQSPEIAAAAAVMLFAVTLVLIAIFFRVQRRAGLGPMSRSARRRDVSKHGLLIVVTCSRFPRLRDDHGGVQDAGELPRASVGAVLESRRSEAFAPRSTTSSRAGSRTPCRSRARRSSFTLLVAALPAGDSRAGRSAGATPCSACSSR